MTTVILPMAVAAPTRCRIARYSERL